MMKNPTRIIFATLVLAAAPALSLEHRVQSFEAGGGVWRLKLPTGYVLEHLATMVGPRLMVFDEDGALLVGSRAGFVYRLRPPYRRADVYADLGGYPHGVALRGEELFVAKSNGIYRAPYLRRDVALTSSDFTRLVKLPAGGGHSSRSIGVGPDQRIYASIGISGNCSDEYLDESYSFQKRRGGVLVLIEPKGARQVHWRTYASGLRNPIGFDWHPVTGALYASNHGPDHHGYEQPPEYFSRLDTASFHGMPWFQFNGRETERDRCIEKSPPRRDVAVPVATFPARNAPMGVAFAPRVSRWAGNAAVALHGSWGTRPHGGFIGPRASRRPPWIALVRFDGGEPSGAVEGLVEGFQDDQGDRLARPVGVAFGPDGALYFTSDGGVVEGLFRLRRM